MMKNFLTVIMFLLVFLTACNSESEKITTQADNFWIVLNREDAKEIEGMLQWNFNLNTIGKYNVQIVSNGELTKPLPELSVTTVNTNITETPKKIFVLGDEEKVTISQYNKILEFDEVGLQTINVEANSSIKQIRITPRYTHTLGFGSGKYADEWLTMHNSSEKQAGMKWLKEAKYGMFIHWGLYSQAGGIWKDTQINESPYPGPAVAEWLMFKFRIPRDEYAQLAKTFNPDKSFAQTIAKLAKDAGMKYMVITSKHHDGFALFDSKCSEYDMVDATPYKADAIKELYEACLAEGIKFGVYYSHGNDWYDGTDGNVANVKKRNDAIGILTHLNGKNLWDPSANTFEEYVENKSLEQVKELINLMPELALIWFDGEGNITEDQAFKFYKTIYDMNPNIIVNRRIGWDFGDYLDAGDNVIPSVGAKMDKYWETCGTTNNSWGYKSYDHDWKSTDEMLYYLIDIASKGGNYLLNIGPDGRGHVPDESAALLREVGQWLKINGEAIYGTTNWVVPNEGQEETLLEGTGHRAKKGFSKKFTKNDFWFTAKENKVYAISLVNVNEQVTIKSLKNENGTIAKVQLLGGTSKLDWKQDVDGLLVDLSNNTAGTNGYVLEITLKK